MSYATLAQLGCESNEKNIVENYNDRDCDRVRIKCQDSCRGDMCGQPICTKVCMGREGCRKNIHEGFNHESCTDIQEKCRVDCWTNKDRAKEIGHWQCRQECMKDNNCQPEEITQEL